MLLEVPPRSPSPCFESPCLFLKVFLVRPLRPCYCSWADVRSPFSPPALLWFGGTALPPRAWAVGTSAFRQPPHSQASLTVRRLLQNVLSRSSLLSGVLNSPGSAGFAFFSFRSAFFSASHRPCLFLTPILILTCTRRLTPVLTGAITCHLLQRGG